jgi:hypothetical protein
LSPIADQIESDQLLPIGKLSVSYAEDIKDRGGHRRIKNVEMK